MRIQVRYTTEYGYQRAARSIVQVLRLTPRSHEGQHVANWRIETDIDATLRPSEDAYGNIVHTLYTEAPTDRLTLTVLGEVETFDTDGVLRRTVERLPEAVYLRDTPLTEADAELKAFSEDVMGRGEDRLEQLHALLTALKREVAFDVDATGTGTTAAQAFGLRRGVCQDLTHMFLAAARHAGVPARYVSGHLARSDTPDQTAGHAWAEAQVEELGWVGFDPVNGMCPTDAYVRVAVGLDYLAAAPVRGAHYGGGAETMNVRLHVADMRGSSQ